MLGKPRILSFSQTRLINSIKHEHLCKILYLKCSFGEVYRQKGAQWLSGRVLDSRPRGRGFEPHGRHCVVSLSKNINPS